MAKRVALSRADVLRVAAAAGLDPRTVARILAGGATRSAAVRAALAAAVRSEGFNGEADRVDKGAA